LNNTVQQPVINYNFGPPIVPDNPTVQYPVNDISLDTLSNYTNPHYFLRYQTKR
jgi:hypothetical protein